MTPKEKAEELREKCDGYIGYALVAVDEILKELSPLDNHPLGTYINPKIEYWQEVKQEVEKI